MNNSLQAFESLSPLATMSKGEIKELSKKQIEEIVESGSSEQSYAVLHKFKTLIEEVLDGIKESAISEVGKGNNSAFGVSMKIQSKTTYNYKHDPNWLRLDNAKKEYEKLMVSKLNDTLSFKPLNEETGEVIEVLPAHRSVSDYIKTEF